MEARIFEISDSGRDGSCSYSFEATGNAFYDQLLVVDALFKSRFSGIGMAIMGVSIGMTFSAPNMPPHSAAAN